MDLRHIKHWVFDLDNTLYPPEARLFDQIEVLMETFITRELGVDLEEARHLRSHYWKLHGTTLAGLMAEHGVAPDAFLAEVHELDYSALFPDPALAAAIAKLPGQRIIYTNGSISHGEGVSRARGLRDSFHHVFGIEDAAYIPKPARDAFDRVWSTAGIDPNAALMVEDDPRNLEVPKAQGMVTVLVGSNDKPDHVDYAPDNLTQFLETIEISSD